MCCGCCGVMQQKVWVFGGGLALVILGVVMAVWWPSWVDAIVYKSLPLTPTSRTYGIWKEAPVPIFIYFYLFNWTNPAEVRTPGVKPNFEQLGPYVFREQNYKTILEWGRDYETVTYNSTRTWFFEPELSGGKADDLITAPHLPSIAAASQVRDRNILVKMVFSQLMQRNGGTLNTTHTAMEWLFDGFYDEFLDFAMNLDMPETANITTNRFAFFLDRNGTTGFEGSFTIHTGVATLQNMGELQAWKGSNQTGFFDGECGKVNGSASDLWVPNRPLDEWITVYITDTCRIINLVPTEEPVQVAGIEGVKYETKRETFDNGQLNPDMECFCPAELRPNNCPKTGATHLGGCAGGAPMFLSHGNFMYADESYRNTTTGLEPNYDEDNFYIVMQTKMGIPLKVNAVVQISLLIEPDKDIAILRGVPSFYAPLFLINSRVEMSEELARQIRLVLKLPAIGRYSGVALAVVGAVMIGVAVYLTKTQNWHGQTKEANPLIAAPPPSGGGCEQSAQIHAEKRAVGDVN